MRPIRREVKRYGRVFQYGTQQRSMAHVRYGCELVRNGRLGKVQSVEVTAPSYGFEGGSLEPIPVPEGLDYDLWLGPAPWRPYTKDRCTCWGTYWCCDNAHGFIGGWGAHPLTDMVWAMGDDARRAPCRSSTRARASSARDFSTRPYDWDIRGKFASGASFHFTPGGDCATIVGERGKVPISRGGLTHRAGVAPPGEDRPRRDPPLRQPEPHGQLHRLRAQPPPHGRPGRGGRPLRQHHPAQHDRHPDRPQDPLGPGREAILDDPAPRNC